MKYIPIIVLLFTSINSLASDEFSYENISKRNQSAAMTNQEVNRAKMNGECLVGIKELNFRKKDQFDPIAEWTTYRTTSLLDHLPPCEVLIIMEVARERLMGQSK